MDAVSKDAGEVEQVLAEVHRLRRHQRRLTLYCGGVTLLALAGLLMGATAQRNASFDVIDVQRINIKEPDGTLRLVVSNRTLFPGAFMKGREIVEHARPMAGMLFLNDEGTENGGLIFNGRRDDNGKPDSGLSLTFDRYQQDQQLQLLGLDGPRGAVAGLQLNDVADGQLRPMFSAEDERLHAQGVQAITRRVFLGRTQSRNAMLQLLDGAGQPRLQLQVTPKGEATLSFLDEHGDTVRVISAEQL
ncbi:MULTISPECIES: hypothetical protein [Stenotrophomonas]|uniref:Transmembrane protein n=1 Tax=Stenotrophomonas maltophilia TaxID=40324 RepID=A0A3S0HSE7_STEMA|nr:hypothetical protein [Stenotrophomonas maltophilia]RTQ84463.1 hypothetical protein EKL94_20700 [Stenotrophomonas maltophilia]